MTRLPAALAAALLLASCASPEEHDLARVRRDDLPITVEATGDLRARESTALSPPSVAQMWTYKIARMAPESTEVQAGDPVLSFDTTELQRDLERRLAEREQAQKEIEQKELELTEQRLEFEMRLASARASVRKTSLKVDVPEELMKRVELEQFRLDHELATREVEATTSALEALEESGSNQLATLRSRFERADLSVQELNRGIEQMTVRAPRAGLVVHVSDWRGEKKKEGDNVSRWDTVLEIPDLASMEAEAEIDEVDAGRVAEGQAVHLRLEAHPDREYTGTVLEIARTLRRKSWRNPTKVYRMVIALDETDQERMRPGMRFRGDIEVDRVPDALLIPLESVFPRAGGPVVYVKTAGGLTPVEVELGARSGGQVEVLGGLDEGQRVSRRPPDDERRPS